MSHQTPWQFLNISKATFYRRKLHLDKRFLEIERFKQYVQSGLYIKPWSDSYMKEITRLLRSYFAEYHSLTKENAEAWINAIDPSRHSYRHWRHRTVSAYSRFLHKCLKKYPSLNMPILLSFTLKSPLVIGQNATLLILNNFKTLFKWLQRLKNKCS